MRSSLTDGWTRSPTANSCTPLFERFVRELVEAGRQPKYPQDMERLNAILDALIEEYRDEYPPPTDHAFQTQRSQLQQAARVFLIEEDRYCAENRGTPVYLESSFGLKREGVPARWTRPSRFPSSSPMAARFVSVVGLTASTGSGKGAMDTYAVWDYKSGSAWKYNEADPFRQGRVIQPTLYIAMVAHRLRAELSSKAKVARFGFFFPGAKGARSSHRVGHRTACRGKESPRATGRHHSPGAVSSPPNNKDDCNYCNYASICGDAEAVAAASAQKLANAENKILQPIRELRNHVEE